MPRIERKRNMNRTGNVARMAAGLAFTASLLVAPGATRAQHLGNDTIALFPKKRRELHMQFEAARTQKWFPQLRTDAAGSDSAS